MKIHAPVFMWVYTFIAPGYILKSGVNWAIW